MTEISKASPRPCPFCGSSNVETAASAYTVWVKCLKCGADGPTLLAGKNEDAVNLWNKLRDERDELIRGMQEAREWIDNRDAQADAQSILDRIDSILTKVGAP